MSGGTAGVQLLYTKERYVLGRFFPFLHLHSADSTPGTLRL
jgi:hypothetical protein